MQPTWEHPSVSLFLSHLLGRSFTSFESWDDALSPLCAQGTESRAPPQALGLSVGSGLKA